jgi:hypothetical protein
MAPPCTSGRTARPGPRVDSAAKNDQKIHRRAVERLQPNSEVHGNRAIYRANLPNPKTAAWIARVPASKVHRRAGDNAPRLKPTEESVSKPEQNPAQLFQALENQIRESGYAVLGFLRETIEHGNSCLKQNAFGHFPVRRLAPCQAVLALACITHHVTRWKARETARSLRAVT